MGRRVAPIALAALLAAGCFSAPVLDLGPMPLGVTAETALTYYDISAGTLNEIGQAIRLEGPRSQGRRWGAITTWNMSWQAQFHNIGGAFGGICEARRVRIRVRTAINFPRWNPTAQPDSALLVWWQQYNAGLAEHERGHALLAVRGAGEIAKALDGMQASCAMINTQLSTKFNQMVLAINTRQVEYDLTTRHGATQIQRARALNEP